MNMLSMAWKGRVDAVYEDFGRLLCVSINSNVKLRCVFRAHCVCVRMLIKSETRIKIQCNLKKLQNKNTPQNDSFRMCVLFLQCFVSFLGVCVCVLFCSSVWHLLRSVFLRV